MNESSCCFTSLPAFGGVFLDFDHSHRCMVYFIVVFICSLLMIPDIGHLFMFICQLYIFFGGISVHIFCPFLNKIVHFIAEEFLVYFGCTTFSLDCFLLLSLRVL